MHEDKLSHEMIFARCSCQFNPQLTFAESDIGSPLWWSEIERHGAPLLEKKHQGAYRAHFIWRQTKPDSIKRIYIDIHGITNHHSFHPAELIRYKQTDVYYFSCYLPETWRGGYVFLPASDDYLQPGYYGDIYQQKSQHRSWLNKLFTQGKIDPLNPNNIDACEWGKRYSPLAMDKAPQQLGWEAFDTQRGNAGGRHALSMLTWHSALMNKTRRVWLYNTAPPTQQNIPMVIMQDGDFWSQHMPVFSAIDNNTDSGYLPAAVYVLIDAIDMPNRGEDLPCNALFWQAIMSELLPMVEKHYPVTQDAAQTVVAGQSFGGLSSMYAALNWPQRFGCVIAQSASFWWPDKHQVQSPYQNSAQLPVAKSEMATRIEAKRELAPLKVYIEVGLREGPMLELSQQVYTALQTHGHHQVHLHRFDGGHERYCWRGGLMQGLHFVLGKSEQK